MIGLNFTTIKIGIIVDIWTVLNGLRNHPYIGDSKFIIFAIFWLLASKAMVTNNLFFFQLLGVGEKGCFDQSLDLQKYQVVNNEFNQKKIKIELGYEEEFGSQRVHVGE